jgi:ATP-binding cassette subfamily B protein
VSSARQGGGAWSGDLEREASLGKAYDSRLIGRLWVYVRPYRRSFWLSMICLPLSSACALLQPYLLKRAIDGAMASRDTAGLLQLAFVYAVAMTAEFGFLYLQYYLTMTVAQRSLADLRRELITHLQRLPAEFFDRNPVGRLVTRLTSDVDVVNEMFASGGLTILMDVVTLLGIVGIMLAIDFDLALVTLLVCPVLVVAINFFRLKARRSYRLIRDRLARLNAYLQEALAGMAVIQLFARERASWQRFDRFNDDHRRANHASNIYEASLFSLVESVSSISFAVIVWYGGGQILAGALAFGTLVAFIEYIQKFFVPIRDFSTKYAVMQSAMSSAERIFQLLDTPVLIESPAEPVRVERPRGRIEFDRVWFAYQAEDWVLRDVSFVVEPGEKVAFVGPTGSGKTTVMKLLNRSYDVQRGRVLVDGVDVRDWDLSALRRHIGVVLQDVFLFAGTVASNLTLDRADVRLDDAIEASRVVHADPFIRRLPSGYQERVRERGNNLSAGQRQLLAFARALAYRPTILVLDEATSSVDTETEYLIQDALEKLLRGRTAVVIAHRLSTIERSDRILVMLGGEIRERGTHAELLRQRGLYFKLYELQYAQGEVAPSAPEVTAVAQEQ